MRFQSSGKDSSGSFEPGAWARRRWMSDDGDGHRPVCPDPSRGLVGRVDVDDVDAECFGQLGPDARGGVDPPTDGSGVAGGDFLVRVEEVRVVVGRSEVDRDGLGQLPVRIVAKCAAVDDVQVGNDGASPVLATAATVAGGRDGCGRG